LVGCHGCHSHSRSQALTGSCWSLSCDSTCQQNIPGSWIAQPEVLAQTSNTSSRGTKLALGSSATNLYNWSGKKSLVQFGGILSHMQVMPSQALLSWRDCSRRAHSLPSSVLYLQKHTQMDKVIRSSCDHEILHLEWVYDIKPWFFFPNLQESSVSWINRNMGHWVVETTWEPSWTIPFFRAHWGCHSVKWALRPIGRERHCTSWREPGWSVCGGDRLSMAIPDP
jgi:hypothetical protein